MITPVGDIRITPVSRMMTALLVTIVLSAYGGTVESSAASSADLSANFESGTLQGWSATAGATVTPQAAAAGRFGAQISATQAPGYLNWSSNAVQQGRTYASLRTRVQVVSHGSGQSLDLITIQNSKLVSNFDFFVTGDTQRFKWDLYRGNTGQSSFTVVPGRWYLIEVQCAYAGTSYGARVRIDGVDQGIITSPGQLPATVRAVWLGTTNSKTHVQRYDDVALKLGDSWPGYLGP